MKQYTVSLTRGAKEDLENIIYYISRSLQEPTTAQNISIRLNAAASSLSMFPFRWPQYQTEPWSSMGIRKAIEGNYILLFTVEESRVLIHAVVYGHQDLDTLLAQRFQ